MPTPTPWYTAAQAVLAQERTPMTDDAPRTAAGRALLEQLQTVRLGRWDRALAVADILAIEAEATALAQGRSSERAATGAKPDLLDAATVKRWLDEWLPHDPIPDGWRSNIPAFCTESKPCEVHATLARLADSRVGKAERLASKEKRP